MLESPWNTHNNAHQHYNDGKYDCALRVVGQSIEDSCASKYMEADQHDVVGQKHETGKFIGNLGLAECVVPEVADIADLRMLHDKFVHGLFLLVCVIVLSH